MLGHDQTPRGLELSRLLAAIVNFPFLQPKISHFWVVAEGAPGRFHGLICHRRSHLFDQSAFVVAPVRFAVGFEATPLIEMKQSPPEMVQR